MPLKDLKGYAVHIEDINSVTIDLKEKKDSYKKNLKGIKCLVR